MFHRDKDEEDPAVTMYYYSRQQGMKDMQRDSYQRKESTVETTVPSGTSYVLSNLSRNAFAGISIQQEPKSREGFRTNSLPMLPQGRRISNFLENLPNNQPKMTNVGPLLQGTAQTDR